MLKSNSEILEIFVAKSIVYTTNMKSGLFSKYFFVNMTLDSAIKKQNKSDKMEK